jgi:hypothetical protein
LLSICYQFSFNLLSILFHFAVKFAFVCNLLFQFAFVCNSLFLIWFGKCKFAF